MIAESYSYFFIFREFILYNQITDCLDEIGYIVPGLGDAGDRIFGIK